MYPIVSRKHFMCAEFHWIWIWPDLIQCKLIQCQTWLTVSAAQALKVLHWKRLSVIMTIAKNLPDGFAHWSTLGILGNYKSTILDNSILEFSKTLNSHLIQNENFTMKPLILRLDKSISPIHFTWIMNSRTAFVAFQNSTWFLSAAYMHMYTHAEFWLTSKLMQFLSWVVGPKGKLAVKGIILSIITCS